MWFFPGSFNDLFCIFIKKQYFLYFFSLKYLFLSFNKYLISGKVTFFSFELILKQYCLLFIVLFFKYHFFFKLQLLVDIIVKDFFMKKLRFQISYFFRSLKWTCFFIISIFKNEKLPTFSLLTFYKNANWFEREIWDFFGIYVLNHLDLRRILTDYNFLQFPLRKDFPLSGFFEIFYSDLKKKINFTQISFLQEYRLFDLKFSWLNQ